MSRILGLVIAAVCGVAAIFVTRIYLLPAGPPPEPEDMVVVANVDIPRGSTLDPAKKIEGKELLRLETRKRSALTDGFPDGYFLGQAGLEKLYMEKRFVKSNILVGEYITPRRISQPNEVNSMSTRVKPGFRAHPLRVTPESAVNGFILPEDKVDVVASSRTSRTAKILLQDIMTIASAESMIRSSEKNQIPSSLMTFELKPDQISTMLKTLSERETLSLLLRNPADTTPLKPEDMSSTYTGTEDSREEIRQRVRKLEKSFEDREQQHSQETANKERKLAEIQKKQSESIRRQEEAKRKADQASLAQANLKGKPAPKPVKRMMLIAPSQVSYLDLAAKKAPNSDTKVAPRLIIIQPNLSMFYDARNSGDDPNGDDTGQGQGQQGQGQQGQGQQGQEQQGQGQQGQGQQGQGS